MSKSVKVGIVGLGTVGSGTVNVLQRNAEEIASRVGRPCDISHIGARRDNPNCDITGIKGSRDVFAVAADPDVDILVELIGGTTTARDLILQAIANGKHVVTANKALIAEHGNEIFTAAHAKGVDVAFEASVAGGIPILRSLREGLAGNHIESVYGIMNGTTNYVLTQMEATGEPFDVVVKRAQDLGYAEADPSFDLDGVDAAHKLTLLVAMAFGADLTYKEISTEGIRGLTPVDFAAAAEFGYRIKLLGIAKAHRGSDGEESIEARVHPTMIPATSLLANVDGAMNAVAVTGDFVGPTLFYGAGAGELAAREVWRRRGVETWPGGSRTRTVGRSCTAT